MGLRIIADKHPICQCWPLFGMSFSIIPPILTISVNFKSETKDLPNGLPSFGVYFLDISNFYAFLQYLQEGNTPHNFASLFMQKMSLTTSERRYMRKIFTNFCFCHPSIAFQISIELMNGSFSLILSVKRSLFIGSIGDVRMVSCWPTQQEFVGKPSRELSEP